MSAAADTVAAPAGAERTLRALTRIETLRLLRHPVFLGGLALFVWQYTSSVLVTPEPSLRGVSETWAVLVAFFLGLAGFLALHGLTRSTRASRDVVGAVPLDEPTRTLALCLTALVPFGLAVLSGIVALLFWEPTGAPDPQRDYTVFTRTEIWSFHGCVLLAALGGPLLGIAVARWWRWPMAGTVVAIVLVAWCVTTNMFTTDLPRTLHHLAGPFSLMVTGAESEEAYRQAGSWAWHLPYIASLCVLAALAAVLHGADGRRRAVLLRAGWAVAAVAVVLLVVSAVTGPEGVSLWRA